MRTTVTKSRDPVTIYYMSELLPDKTLTQSEFTDLGQNT